MNQLTIPTWMVSMCLPLVVSGVVGFGSYQAAMADAENVKSDVVELKAKVTEGVNHIQHLTKQIQSLAESRDFITALLVTLFYQTFIFRLNSRKALQIQPISYLQVNGSKSRGKDIATKVIVVINQEKIRQRCESPLQSRINAQIFTKRAVLNEGIPKQRFIKSNIHPRPNKPNIII